MKITTEQRDAWRDKTANSSFNTWLNARVTGPDGRLDLDRLHEVARHYGIDKKAAYAHLNPGQQRMSLGNILRRVVDPREYGGDANAPSPLRSLPEPAPEPRPDVVRNGNVGDLLRLHGHILDELLDRGVIRTLNSPTGDYAETLFARAFGWSLEANSSAGHDATDSEGVRYQIKCRRLTPRNGSRQLSAIRKLEAKTFDFVAAVLFDQGFGVLRAAIIPHDVIRSRARFRSHTNAWLFELKDDVWAMARVRDVTEAIRTAADGV